MEGFKTSKVIYHDDARKSLCQEGARLPGLIKHYDLPKREKSFVSDRPASKITPADLVAEPEFGMTDSVGAFVARFFHEDGKILGIGGEDYNKVSCLVDNFFKISWIKAHLSRPFVEENIFGWCKCSYRKEYIEDLPAYIAGKALSAGRVRTAFVPVSFLQIERPLSLGLAKFVTLTKGFLDKIEGNCLDRAPKQVNDVLKLFAKLRSDFQGMAAVKIEVTGDERSAQATAERIAEEAIGFLRLFSEAAYEPRTFCACAIAGAEYAPKFKLMTLGSDDAFSYREESKLARFWQLSAEEAEAIEQTNWSFIERLVNGSRLSPFQVRLKTCLLSLSKGLTFPDFADRLVYLVSSLEGLLLKDATEPIQHNMGERIAFAVTDDPDKRRRIVNNTKNIYKIRSDYVHHRINSFHEEQEIGFFYENARKFVHYALASTEKVNSVQEFIAIIEDIKYRNG